MTSADTASHHGALTPAGDAPLVTVIVRSLDRPYLREALASVVTQTWPAIEVVVVAARPGHAALPELGSFPAHAGRRELRLLDTDVRRLRSHAANVGLDAARGQYLIFLDDDDWLMPGHIERLVHTLQTHTESLAAYTGVALVDAEQRPLGQIFDIPFDAVRQLAGNITPIHAVLFDARLLQRGCRFDEALDRYEDWDFWIQMARQTVFIHLPGVSALYRIHPSSGVHEDPDVDGRSSARVYEKWQAIWGPEQIGQLMRRVMSHDILEAQLAAAQQGSAVARQTADDTVAQIGTVKHHVDGLRVPLDSLQQLVMQQHAVLHQLGQDEAQRVEHVGRQLDGHAASLNQQLAQVQAQVHGVQQTQHDLQGRADAQGHALSGLVARQQAQAEQQTEALKFLAQVQTDTAGRWAVLDQQLEQHNATQARTDATVAQLADKLGQLEAKSARQDALEQLQQQGARQVAELRLQLGEQLAAVSGLDRHLEEQTRAAARLAATLAESSSTLAEVSASLSRQTVRAEQLNHQIHALQSSTSWRITKPLRVLVDALSRPFRGRGS